MATEIILGSIQAVCYAICFVVILFVLSVPVTLIVLPIFGLVLPFLYRIGARTLTRPPLERT